MSDDWRVTATLQDAGRTSGVLHFLDEHQVEEEVRRLLTSHVAVSGSDSEVFLYADSEESATQAQDVLEDILRQHGLQADFALHRWHPVEERWEAPDVALPSTPAEQEAERQLLMHAETQESTASGYAAWEVRVQLDSHRDAVRLAQRLTDEGRSVVRRWRFLVVGATNEDEARQLAEAIRSEASPDARVGVEAGGGIGWQDGMPGTPFTIFASLGG
ncbi:MAG: hypothetical protein ACRDPG_10105 [Nocardioidaceae bacterium]